MPRAETKGGGAAITFECTNGHRIHVPAKLAGKRGTCSKCGVPVVIPLATAPAAVEQPIAEAVAPATAPADHALPTDAFADLFAGVAASAPTAPEEIVVDITGVGELPGGGSAVGDVVAGYGPEEIAPPDDGNAGENPTAQLVARLWLERAHSGVVEIHLAGGAVPILPEWYEPRWSRGTHGLFASQAADGTVTLTAVAWDSVQKIVVRGVKGLPDGMFE